MGRSLPEVLVPLRKFPLTALVFDQQARCPSYDPDSGYRQIAQLPSYVPQPSSLPGPARENQLEIVASSEREVNWISTRTAQPLARLSRNGDRGSIEGDAHGRCLRNLAHTIGEAITQVHAARCGTITTEQYAGTNAGIGQEVPRRALLCLFERISTVCCVHCIAQSQQPACTLCERSAHVHFVARSGARASEDLSTVHRAKRRDVEDHGPRCARDVASDQRNAIAPRDREQSIDDLLERCELERIGQRHREHRRSRARTHRSKVTQVDGKHAMSDGSGRHEPSIEVHAFDLRVRGDNLQRTTYRLDRGRVVSRTDNDPWRGGQPRPDASDEIVLTAIGYCLRIQNWRAVKSPALPCGEVE
jgi:hypothetical protein